MLALGLAMAAASGGQAAASAYQVVELADPTSRNDAQVYGINSSGQIVGSVDSYRVNNGAVAAQAVIWSRDGQIASMLTAGGGTGAQAYGINDAGVVVGTKWMGTGNLQGVTWSASGQLTALPNVLGTNAIRGNAISNAGAVAGKFVDGSPGIWTPGVGGTLSGARLAGGIGEGLGINAAGDVVGSFNASFADHAAKWSGGVRSALATIAGVSDTYACAINGSGVAAGYGQGASSHALRWAANGTVTELTGISGDGAAVGCSANAINSAGEVVGYSVSSSGATSATLWSASGVAIDLAAVLGTDWTNTQAVGINDRGDIIGYGTYKNRVNGNGGGDGTTAFVLELAAVPEPAAWAVLLVGVAGVAGVRRWRVRDGAVG